MYVANTILYIGSLASSSSQLLELGTRIHPNFTDWEIEKQSRQNVVNLFTVVFSPLIYKSISYIEGIQ